MSHAGIAKLARPHPRLTEPDPLWREQAACRNYLMPDDFYSDGIKALSRTAKRAKDKCEECPVRLACLEEALSQPDQWGIWGGMTARERTRLKNKQRKERARAA